MRNNAINSYFKELNSKLFLFSISLSMIFLLSNKTLAQTQSDSSDNYWRVVVPRANSHDIDMGKVLLGSYKDSMITPFISNVGSYKCTINDIRIKGTNATDFYVISNRTFSVLPGMYQPIEFHFKPGALGKRVAVVEIESNDTVITQNIIGEGVQPQVQVLSKIIDFGLVKIGTNKDTLQAVTIKNTGTAPLTITNTRHAKPNDYDFSTLAGAGPFTLAVGETKKMDLRFTPSSSGRTSGLLEFEYNDVGSPAIIQLYGEGDKIDPIIQTDISSINDIICQSDAQTTLRLSNKGEKALKIYDISISGKNPNDFSVLGYPKMTIEPDTLVEITVLFKPTQLGLSTASLDIHSNSNPDSILSLPLSGRKDSVSIVADIQTIDLGTIAPKTQRDTSIIIHNTGSIKTGFNISNSGLITTDINSGSLSPSDFAKINIHFKGSSMLGPIKETIAITDTICNRNLSITITGFSLDSVSALLHSGTLSAYPGEMVEIPIYLKNAYNIFESGAKGFNVEMLFNSTLLFPIDYPSSQIEDGLRKLTLILPTNNGADGLLAKIKCYAALGDSEECDILLQNPNLIGWNGNLQVISGSFKLLGICREGGARLVNGSLKTALLAVSPNPANESLEIEYANADDGPAEFKLINALGQELLSKRLSKTQYGKELINLRAIPQGVYFGTFSTESRRECIKIGVIK